MITYGFLELDEKILATDEVRNTQLEFGYGDYPLNGNAVESWGSAEERIPGWIGKTLKDYLKFVRANARNTGNDELDIEIRRRIV